MRSRREVKVILDADDDALERTAGEVRRYAGTRARFTIWHCCPRDRTNGWFGGQDVPATMGSGWAGKGVGKQDGRWVCARGVLAPVSLHVDISAKPPKPSDTPLPFYSARPPSPRLHPPAHLTRLAPEHRSRKPQHPIASHPSPRSRTSRNRPVQRATTSAILFQSAKKSCRHRLVPLQLQRTRAIPSANKTTSFLVHAHAPPQSPPTARTSGAQSEHHPAALRRRTRAHNTCAAIRCPDSPALGARRLIHFGIRNGRR
jgi:hypothetical protein